MRGQHVQQPHRPGVAHQRGQFSCTRSDKVGKGGVFQALGLVFGRENLGFQLFQLLGDVALGLRQGLLADPAFRHLVLVGVADFEVVPKHVVERHLQPRDSRGLSLPVSDGVKGFLAVERQPAHVVELGVDPSGNDLSLADGHGGFVHELLVQPGEQCAARAQGLQIRQQRSFPSRGVGHRLHGVQSPADMAQFAGVDAARTRLGSQPLEVPHTSEDGPQFMAKGDFFCQPVHGFVALGQRVQVGQRRHQGPTQSPPAHGRACPVQDLDQRGAVFVVWVQDFKIAHREPVQPHPVGGSQPGHALDVGRFPVVGQIQVMEHSPNRNGG